MTRYYISILATIPLVATNCAVATPDGGDGGDDNGGGEESSPNIIVILCDDLGYADVSFNTPVGYDSGANTPNIDRIANEGAMFTSAYTTYSSSGPSRIGLLTGRYSQCFGIEKNPNYNFTDELYGIPVEETNIAEALSEAGYTTGAIGKWHAGMPLVHHPCNRGFDEFFGFLGGGHRYFTSEYIYSNCYENTNSSSEYYTWIMRNHDHVDPADMTSDYLTYAFSDEAVSFVERHKDEPFFLYLAYNAPHSPLQSPDGRTASTSTMTDEERKEIYRLMVGAVDDGVGDILDKLEELGIDDNTLIFFLSDNGGKISLMGDNGVLRGEKFTAYEGGYRVPYAMRWPAVIPAQMVYDNPVSSLDIYATATALAEVSSGGRTLDGVNLIPYLLGEKSGLPHETIYLQSENQGWHNVRCGDYKLYCDDGDAVETVYNLKDNISELDGEDNLERDNTEKLNELKAIFDEWEATLPTPLW